MAYPTVQPTPWGLARSQHGVITRAQLLALGFTGSAIKHRVAKGRLHLVARGVYAVGRPELTRHGLFMAAVLACGPDAVLSHASAAALWGICGEKGRLIEVTVPGRSRHARSGILTHRRSLSARETTVHHGIPVTTPACTIVDIAPALTRHELESAINEADKLDLIDPNALREAAGEMAGRRGAPFVKKVLDRRTFTLTDSQTEQRFLPIARSAGLPLPLTRRYVNGFKVDFWWPDLGLIVETDGLSSHRTPAEQAADRLRDQTHTAAGLTCLRFTRAQVRFEPGHVHGVLSAVAARLLA